MFGNWWLAVGGAGWCSVVAGFGCVRWRESGWLDFILFRDDCKQK